MQSSAEKTKAKLSFAFFLFFAIEKRQKTQKKLILKKANKKPKEGENH